MARGSRDSVPQTGRWTAKDPIAFAGGSTGLFSYVDGDPINRIDADGLEWTLAEKQVAVTTAVVLTAITVNALIHQSRGRGADLVYPDPNTDKLLQNLKRKAIEIKQVFAPPPNLGGPEDRNDPTGAARIAWCFQQYGSTGRTPNVFLLTICWAGAIAEVLP